MRETRFDKQIHYSLTVMRFMSSCFRWSTQRRTACLYHVSRATGFPSRVSSQRECSFPRQTNWSKLERYNKEKWGQGCNWQQSVSSNTPSPRKNILHRCLDFFKPVFKTHTKKQTKNSQVQIDHFLLTRTSIILKLPRMMHLMLARISIWVLWITAFDQVVTFICTIWQIKETIFQ